ncbi:hypothetical protein [Cellulomonas denverensis]|uniref:Uncharacterized protein n=1 Tax=Cellulomonas denverensis TaxID=264297 RepID=A0A7X6KW28_9CELL|nr:hypothetical protein [Cellulomonas denverensis]NKY23098.1 hypothetical protein [Cellulomonas denverensis]GIG23821.1 hypothetical protein Cde04nite_00650 [Cellulomonas denverensis]
MAPVSTPTPRHRARRPLRTGRRRNRTIAAVVATVALVAGGMTAAQSLTADRVFLVDSLATTADANPGDGVCATAAGVCTLRAAIEESNALNGAPGEIGIGVHPDFAGGNIEVVTTNSALMQTGNLSAGGGSITGDSGAMFEVTAPVTIDLEYKITINTTADRGVAVFHLNGPDITLTRMNQVFAGETTFYVGPNASNVLITNGSNVTANYYPERFIVVRGGASNITVSNYSITGYASSASSNWGWGWVDGTSASAPVNGLTFDNVQFLANLSGSCNGSSATGCSSTPISVYQQHVNDLVFTNNTVVNLNRAADNNTRLVDARSATLNNFVFSHNTITNPRIYSGEALIDFGSASSTAATVTDFSITDNVFTTVTAASEATNGMIRLPYGKAISGTGLIARNSFGAATGSMQAIYWFGPYSDTQNVSSSGVRIEDNHFDGWGSTSARSTIRLHRTGAVTVARNTFGTSTGTQTNTVTEEGLSSGSTVLTMVNNQTLGANGKLNTWYPTARTSANAQAAALSAQQCTIELEVAPPSDADNTVDLAAARYPVTPTTLDLYWTAGNTAEVYLESVTLTTEERTTLTVELPLPGDERLAHLPDGATLPVSATTGDVSGGLRVQTQDPNAGDTTASSQFSRVAAIDGTCQPVLTIDQAEDQNDPTLARDLHFTVTSSVPLDPATLGAEDITLAAEPTADTIDATRLNPRVVSVTAVEGSQDTEFVVIVRVDDSATVTASIAANTVTSTIGLANLSPATSTDNQITFTNPVVVSPAMLALVIGKAEGRDYAIDLRAGAPTPSADLVFSTGMDAVGEAHGVTLATPAPLIAAGATGSGALTITAPAGDVAADTPVTIAHTLTSADSNYDGLVVAALDLRLFATDPVIEITKRAYVEVADTSSPASIAATGTESLAGSRLIDGQAVCWVYTVTNISADDWATVLTDAVITDTDTRLGNGGVIGTIPVLGIGESQQLSACAVLIPRDTTAAGS